ncbi:MAG: CAP domain-containing protein [Cyclobacteriaceae bacterium]
MNQLFIFILILVQTYSADKMKPANDCVSKEEVKLFNVINDYRKEKGLKPIAFSASLSQVARMHARDLTEHYDLKDQKTCNPHSWSDNGDWKACCYTNDHKNPECMWLKPMEINGYPGDGFEIVYFHSNEARATPALESWKKSKGHNPVIVNEGTWSKANWNAIGVGIYGNYATVWFGMVKDNAGTPVPCK